MVSFVQLRDFNYGFQRQSVLFCYEISITFGFVGSRDLSDGRFSVSVGFLLLWDFKDSWFWSVMRFQRQRFFPFRNFNNIRFYWVTRS